MSVTSYLFLLVYLPVVCAGWRLTRSIGPRAPRVWLLGAGVLFCGWAAPLSLPVLAAEGAAAYRLGIGITGKQTKSDRKKLAAGCVLVVGVLVLFKYTGFFLAPRTEGLPGWLTPLGLSFSSFLQLFWLRDRYFGEAEDVSPLDYACAVTFFVTATCGPILRMGELVPRLRDPEPFSWESLSAGLYTFALGLGKKVLLAGMFARAADHGYQFAGGLSSVDAALTVLCYTLQIYFDFSGYCDMAWGMGRMLGIPIPRNFDSPYRAVSIADFWDRWHITLSRFFRHCIYIPLGGNRRGMAVTCRNLMIVYLISGLWHGAGWGFVLWGALHGIAMVIHRLWGGKLRLPKWLGWLVTFGFVNCAWVFFRAESLGQAKALFGDLLLGGFAAPAPGLIQSLPPDAAMQVLVLLQNRLLSGGQLLTYWLPMLLIPAGLALLTAKNPVRQGERFRPTVWKAVLCGVCLVLSVLLLSGVDTFIYANF